MTLTVDKIVFMEEYQMYQNTGVLGASTTVAGIAVLPNTGGRSILAYGAIAAIALGISAIILQVAVTVYRRSLRTK